MWKWKFLREGLGTKDDFFERFWVGAMRWLADPEPSARIRIRPDRYVFRQGEDVALSGRALSVDLQPLTGATITAMMISDRDSLRLQPDWGDAGTVALRAGPLPAGHYSYQIEVEEPGAPAVRQEGAFLVEQTGPEWLELAARPDFLREVASVTGGSLHDEESIEQLASLIPHPPLTASLTQEHLLWDHPLPFLLFLIAVGAEWWIRRRNGMA
jgi:hypothetical protein